MAQSSITGGTPAPAQPAGKDVDALGPSDSSDTGSDVRTDRNRSALPDEGFEGALPMQHGTDTDASGTGERAAADPTPVDEDADILPDQVRMFPDAPRGGSPGEGRDADDEVGDLEDADSGEDDA